MNDKIALAVAAGLLTLFATGLSVRASLLLSRASSLPPPDPSWAVRLQLWLFEAEAALAEPDPKERGIGDLEACDKAMADAVRNLDRDVREVEMAYRQWRELTARTLEASGRSEDEKLARLRRERAEVRSHLSARIADALDAQHRRAAQDHRGLLGAARSGLSFGVLLGGLAALLAFGLAGSVWRGAKQPPERASVPAGAHVAGAPASAATSVRVPVNADQEVVVSVEVQSRR